MTQRSKFIHTSIDDQFNNFLFLSIALQVDPDWSFIDFLNAASNRLDLIPSAERAFNASGKCYVPYLTCFLQESNYHNYYDNHGYVKCRY